MYDVHIVAPWKSRENGDLFYQEENVKNCY